MKPILYGSLAAWVAQVPATLNAFAGLGYLFTNSERQRGGLHWLMTAALRSAIGRSGSTVLFQNEADRDELVQTGIVRRSHTRVIAGSGIDVTAFSVKPSPQGTPLVVLPSRMLWDKGVGEFVQAARILKGKGVDAWFVLVGRCDEDNPADIGWEQLSRWVGEGTIEWWGHRNDMSAVYEGATLVVLPSYREGLPKVLLEAAACGKAIIATDVPGCRDIVQDEVNGVLVPPRDSSILAMSIANLLLDPHARETMGVRSREMAVAKWAGPKISEQVLSLYHELLNASSVVNRSPRYV